MAVRILIPTALLRPEAVLIYPVFVCAAFLPGSGQRSRRMPAVLAGAAVLCLAGGGYLVWKQIHFGSLVPNPFYLKVAGARKPDL